MAYTTFYLLGLILSMQVPFVGFQPLRTSEHMAAAGVFLLLYAYAALKYMQVCVCVRMLCTCTYYVHWYVHWYVCVCVKYIVVYV